MPSSPSGCTARYGWGRPGNYGKCGPLASANSLLKWNEWTDVLISNAFGEPFATIIASYRKSNTPRYRNWRRLSPLSLSLSLRLVLPTAGGQTYAAARFRCLQLGSALKDYWGKCNYLTANPFVRHLEELEGWESAGAAPVPAELVSCQVSQLTQSNPIPMLRDYNKLSIIGIICSTLLSRLWALGVANCHATQT